GKVRHRADHPDRVPEGHFEQSFSGGGHTMEDPQVQPISRRRMLKRVGAGTAIAWSTPVLASMRVPAFAATGACDPIGQFCGPPDPLCGQPGVACPLPGACQVGACSITLASDCVCWSFAYC